MNRFLSRGRGPERRSERTAGWRRVAVAWGPLGQARQQGPVRVANRAGVTGQGWHVCTLDWTGTPTRRRFFFRCLIYDSREM